MLVEDDEFLQTLGMLKLATLKNEGFESVLAVDARAAKEIVAKRVPNLMIVDLLLPDISGFELIEQLRADTRYASIPIIIFSNLGQEQDIERGRRLGVLAHYVKANTSLDELLTAVRDAVAKQ